MKKLLLLGTVILMSITLHAQRCGDYIDLLGIGIHQESKATIEIPDWENVDHILAEAIYKSDAEPYIAGGDPIKIVFSIGDPDTPDESKTGDLLELDHSGEPPGKEIYVFRAGFEGPAKKVNLNITGYEADFFSFAIYVYRKDGKVYTVKSGELVHVWHNGPDGLSTKIDIPEADEARNITLRFGITELDHDERIAIFTFKADGIEVGKTIQTWNPGDDPDLTGAYIIEEVLLENVGGDIDEITMTMLSKLRDDPDLPRGGDSFIAGVVLTDLPCEQYEPKLLCSFTQGFYGNEGGKMCGQIGTPDLLESLMYEDLIMGLPGNSFAILADEHSAECILKLLPGGGPSKALSGDASCEDLGDIEVNKKGRLKNSLLAQGITLTLNTRLSSELLEFPVDGTEFVTMVAMDCFDPEAGGIPGTEKTYAFNPELVDELPEDATIAELLDLVNRALGGEDISPLTLSQVSDAATLVNEAFDECVVVKGYAEVMPVDETAGESGEGSGDQNEENETQGGTKGVTGVSDNEEDVLGIYPNPVMDHFYLSIPSGITEIKYAAIYSLTGAKVMDIVHPITSGMDQVIEINVSHLNKGIYFVRIETAAGFVNERFGVQ
ncbi:MAG: T9SS type A sorting domain-containing protein [Bacteroidota bacterium]